MPCPIRTSAFGSQKNSIEYHIVVYKLFFPFVFTIPSGFDERTGFRIIHSLYYLLVYLAILLSLPFSSFPGGPCTIPCPP